MRTVIRLTRPHPNAYKNACGVLPLRPFTVKQLQTPTPADLLVYAARPLVYTLPVRNS